MDKFRTILPVKPFDHLLSHQDNILSIGSCFATHIGQRLEAYKFRTQLNPFGILYNPISIANALNHLTSGKKYKTSDLFFHHGLWHSFDHHGSFSHPDQEKMLRQINETLSRHQASLSSTTVLILTLGTARVFVDKKSDEIVANCHKLPGQDFYRKILETETIKATLKDTLMALKTVCPNLQVWLSISPVRHIRDGLVENNRSKSRLLLAAEQLTEAYPWVHYFPAYELVLDDLRDYRFYKEDMIHPTDFAINYIWQYFTQSLFSAQTNRLLKSIEKIIRASQHRPLQVESSAHQSFLENQLMQINGLEKEFSFLSFEKERFIFEQQLISQKK